VGHGVVFEWYRDGVIDGDDEVALLHASEDAGYRSLSEPLVNIRYNLQRALEAGSLSAEQVRALSDEMKRLHYPERSYRRLLTCATLRNWPADTRDRLTRFLAADRVDLKQKDARDLLRRVAAGIEPTPPRPTRDLPCRHHRRERMLHRRLQVRSKSVTGGALLAAISPQLRAELAPALHARWYLREWALLREIACPAPYRHTFIRNWEATCGEASEDWLIARGLTAGECSAALADLALVEWLRRQGPAHFGLAVELGEAELGERAFLIDWARYHGITHPPTQSHRPQQASVGALTEWLLREGPTGFGYSFDLDYWILRELQVLGRIAELSPVPGDE
jgi:TfuA-like protein